MKRNAGYSLVEVMTTMFIASILMAGILGMVWNQQKAYATQERLVESLQKARTGLRYMTQELRMAGFKAYGSSFAGIQTAQPTSIRILSDRDQNGSTSGFLEDITYTYDPTAMKVLKNAQDFMNNVTHFSLTYTLADGTVTGSPADLSAIRKINVTLTVRSKEVDLNSQYKSATLTSDIVPRNMGL